LNHAGAPRRAMRAGVTDETRIAILRDHFISLKTGGDGSVNDRFEALRRGFLERCRGQLAALEALARGEDPAARGDGHELLARAAHSLAGAGGTFGFPDLSRRAARLEQALTGEGGAEPAAVRAALDDLVAELKRVTS
jgi:HPt (histidine-containing phosphotransfer) domain-containing protein